MRPAPWTGHGPRRVAFLHDNAEFGGIETLQVEIVKRLDRTRYEPSVVVTAPVALQSARRFEERLRAVGVRCLSGPEGLGFGRKGVQTGLRLARLLREQRYDIVHVVTRTPEASRSLTSAAVLARVPAIVRTEHVSPAPHIDRWTRFKVRPFDWVTDVILVDSMGDRQQQIELVGRRPWQVVSSYCGIDPYSFDPEHSVAAAKRTLGFDPDVPVVGAVGRLHEQKGHQYLIAAAAKVIASLQGPVRFLIVGDGPEEQSLRSQAYELGIADNICFAGFQAEPLPYMQAMDIVAMPSLWEGFSISMQEFMALGKPMVTSDHHSFREAMVDGEHGLIVPVADGAALANAILRLLDDSELRGRLGRAATERARGHFSIQRHVDELMDTYDRSLQRGTSSRRGCG